MIHTDFEAFSKVSIRDVGAYRYAMDPSTEALLLSWAIGDGPVETWRCDIDLPVCPPDLVDAINGGAMFAAWNAQMERAMWHFIMHRRHGWPDIPIKQWYCTAAQAAALALPRKLENISNAIHLEEHKDAARGKKLINIFCKPRKPTKKDPRIRVMPHDRPAEFLEFVEYNRQDVVTERSAHKAMPVLPPRDHSFFRFDMKINERGLPLDIPLVRNALQVTRHFAAENDARVKELTGGISPTQNQKMLEFLNAEAAYTLDNLQRKQLEEYMAIYQPDGIVRELLELRIEGARVSVKKLLSMLTVVCEDHRARGLFLFWGARTGRWAGKLLQPHNFVRGLFTKFMREWVIALLHDPQQAIEIIPLLSAPLETLSNVMRGFICAPDGRVLYVVDYANIESRIVVWLAGQWDVVEMYRNKVDLYRWMGSHVYEMAPEVISTEQRRVAKHIVLGCGFGMGPPKFVWTCKEQGGIDVELTFAERCVKMYRTLHPKLSHREYGLWKRMENAARDTVSTGKMHTTADGRITFFLEGNYLRMRLPSGRLLSYPYPKLYPGEYGMEVTYMSEHPKTHQWVREKTYGGKLTENAVQAIAADILREGMVNAERHGYEVDGTIHDEILCERDEGTGDLHEFEQLVCQMPSWADGCPIAAEAFTAKRWRKQ